jgi:hypothetical protein
VHKNSATLKGMSFDILPPLSDRAIFSFDCL